MKTVSKRLLQDWLRVAKSRGHDLKGLLNTSGIPWRTYEDSRSHISGEHLARSKAEVRRVLDDQFMSYGREVMSPAFLDRAMIKILAHARNLNERLVEWENVWNLVQGGHRRDECRRE
jgi:hypothetical protein